MSAPVWYSKRGGKLGRITDRWGWPNPVALCTEEGKVYHEEVLSEGWIPLGYCPEPDTRLGWFLYHYRHGRMMRYPWWDVVVFSWRHGWRRSQ